MAASIRTASNKLGGGYPSRWVFGTRGVAGMGEIEPGAMRLVGRAGSIVADRPRPGGVELRLCPASTFQALSGAALQPVAPAPSHRLGQGQHYQHLTGRVGLIANYRTRHLGASSSAGSARRLGGDRRGGAPLSARAIVPHARSAGRTGNLANSGTRPSPSRAASDLHRSGQVRKVPVAITGSGVRRPAASVAALRGAEQGTVTHRVGVAHFGHAAFDRGSEARLGGARA